MEGPLPQYQVSFFTHYLFLVLFCQTVLKKKKTRICSHLHFSLADGKSALPHAPPAVPVLGAGVARHQEQVPTVHVDRLPAQEIFPRYAAHALPLHAFAGVCGVEG